MERNLPVRYTNVTSASLVKTKRLRNCSLLFVGGARRHITEDVCQGIKHIFSLFIFLTYFHYFFHRSFHSMYTHLNIYVPVHRKIVFKDFTENGQCVFQRAWDDLLPNNRILIYCLYDLLCAIN